MEFYIVHEKIPESVHAQTNKGATPLVLAAQHGHTDAVRRLLTLGANVNYRLPNGFSALYLAIQNGHIETALFLINEVDETNINYTLDNGSSALHLAIDLEQKDVALALITRGANLTLRRKTDAYTPLHCAAAKGLTDICCTIIDNRKRARLAKLDLGATVLHTAAIHGQKDTIKLLKRYKLDINSQNVNKETPLMLAIKHGHINVALYLAKHCEINTVNEHGQTASMLAAMTNQFEIADILIKRGESPVLEDKNGRNYAYYLIQNGQYYRYRDLINHDDNDKESLLFNEKGFSLAAQYGHKLLMNYFQEQNISFVSNPDSGLELIHLAVKADHISFLREWLKMTSDYKYPIKSGPEATKTLVYIAAENGSLQCLRELFKVCKPESTAFRNNHLLYGAIVSGNSEIIELVLARCEDINIRLDHDGNKAIHVAVSLGLIDIVRILKRYGADLTEKNAKGLSVFHIAIENDDEEMLTELFELEKQLERLPKDLFEFALSRQRAKCLVIVKEKIHNQPTTSTNQYISGQYIETALRDAVRAGRLEYVENLLKQEIDLNIPLKDSLLQQATEFGHLAIASCLLSHKVSDNSSFDRLKLYTIAIENVQIEIIKLFNQCGLALKKGTPEYIECKRCAATKSLYLKAAIDDNFNQLNKNKDAVLKALDEGDAERFSELIRKMPINQILFTHNGIEQPLLHWVFLDSNPEWAIALLAERTDPQVKDRNGLNILHKILPVSLKSDDEAKRRLRFIDKYWPGCKKKMLNEEYDDGSTIWQIASNLGKISLIYEWMGREIPVDFVTNQGDSMLHIAIMLNHLEFTKTLLESKENSLYINLTNNRGITPLMLAAVAGNIYLIQMLLQHGADANRKDYEQDTALHYALKAKQSIAALELIPVTMPLNTVNRNGRTPLMLASAHGLMPILRMLISETKLLFTDKNGLTALHLAALGNHVEAIKLLVQCGSDINAQQLPEDEMEQKMISGATPLHIAASHGNLEAFQTLVELGADLEKSDARKNTAIEQAIGSRSTKLRQFVYQLKAFHQPEHIVQLLVKAVVTDNVSALRELYLAGHNLDVQKDSGKSLLHFAALTGANRAAAFLVSKNSKIALERLDSNGNTPLHDAARANSINIIKLLCDLQIDLNKKNQEEQTALHLACEGGNYAAVLQLLGAGASMQIVDKNNLTPALVALQKGYIDIVRLMIALGDPSLTKQELSKLPSYVQRQYSCFNTELDDLHQRYDLASQNEYSLFHLAVAFNQMDALRLLCIRCQHLDMINDVDKYKDTPLYLAASERNMQAAIILIEYGASLDLRNKNGETPLDIAKSNKHKNLIEFLNSVAKKKNMPIKPDEEELKDVGTSCWGFFAGRNKIFTSKDKTGDKSSQIGLSTINTYRQPTQQDGVKSQDKLTLPSSVDSSRLSFFSNGLWNSTEAGTFIPSNIASDLLGNESSNFDILDVSSFENNCGLFALALGIKITFKNNPTLKNTYKLPSFLTKIDVDSLQQVTTRTANVSTGLRCLLHNVLLHDATYRERRFFSFIDCCRSFLISNDGSIPADMESFAGEIRTYRQSLQPQWLNVKSNLEGAYNEEAYYARLNELNVEPQDIDTLAGALNALITHPSVTEVTKTLNSYCREEEGLLRRFVKLYKLYQAAWCRINTGQSAERENIDTLINLIDRYFNKKIKIALENDMENSLLIFSFLKETTFNANAEATGITSKENILSTAARLFTEHQLRDHWRGIYTNYCEYVRDHHVMLTADELGCLAKYWHVQLIIEFSDGRFYNSYQNRDERFPLVTLCNPSRLHWQVRVPSQKLTIKSTRFEMTQSKSDKQVDGTSALRTMFS